MRSKGGQKMDKIIFSIVFIIVIMAIVVISTIITNYIFKHQDKIISNRKGGGILLSNLQNTDCSIREADEYMRLTNSVDCALYTGVEND